jgi:arylsulfatase A-like enzyme
MRKPDHIRHRVFELKPNILLISIDSLRADHLSLYGYHRETSPSLDRFAADAAVFDRAFTPANWTGAAIASILTGLYPTCHGYTNLRYYLDENVPSITGILRRSGYETVCFSNNMYMSDRTGLTRGFDATFMQGLPENGRAVSAGSRRRALTASVKNMLSTRMKTRLKDLGDVFDTHRALKRDKGAYQTETALFEWLENRSAAKPFFAYIHYQEPHSIYFPPGPFRSRFFDGSWWQQGQYLEFDHIGYFAGKIEFTEDRLERYQQLYDGEIAYLDWRLGRLFRQLDLKGLLDRTVVVVTADHGENMGEHGYVWHAFCLYDPLIRVPLIIRHPDWFGKSTRVNDLVQTNDIVPTILEGLGIEWDYKNGHQGISLLAQRSRPAVLTETFNPEKMIDRWLKRRTDLSREQFCHYLRDIVCYRTPEEKYIRASDGHCEFYDLVKDPAERDNIYDAGHPRITACEKELEKWRARFKPHEAAADQPGFDKDTWEKMKALGYA